MARARQLAVIDCETDPFQHGRMPEPFIWDIYDGVQHYTMEHVSDVIAFLAPRRYIVYAHNGGKFDYRMPGFLDELCDFDKVMVINGRLARFTIGESEFRDSYNILPVPLSAHDKLEIDYAKMERQVRKQHMPEITRYLHRDTESLFKLVKAFRDEYGNGLTLAGSAMRVWQERSRIEAPQSSPGFYRQLEPYYHGGRVEAFRLGIVREHVRMIDINSAYPYAMLHEHPISVNIIEKDCTKRDTIIPQSMYKVRGVARGCWPHRERNGLSFPHDDVERTYNITGWEMLAAMETDACAITKIITRCDFDKTINFDKYIHHFYAMKQSAAADQLRGKNSPDYIFAKLFMNSLYGKFGANPENYCNYTVMHPKYHDAAVADGYDDAGELGPWLLMSTNLEPEQERYYNVATAASITGFVRAYLWRAIHALRHRGADVFYCDTDSLTFSGGSGEGIELGKELGQWSDEGTFDHGGIGGKKIYAWHKEGKDDAVSNWKTACKGARLTPQEIMAVCAGVEVTYRSEAPTFAVTGHGRFITRRVRMTGDKVCQ